MNTPVEARFERWLSRLNLGFALPVVAVLLFLIAWNRGITLLYGMFALVVGTLVFGYTSPRFNLRGVTVRRTHPASVNEGEQFTLALELEKTGLRPLYMLEVVDRIPFAGDQGQAPMAFIERMQGRRRVELPTRVWLRGEHRLGPLRVASGYPLGIRRVERTLADSESSILVYPSTFPIHGLALTGSTQSPLTGSRAVTLSGASERFLGVREYRHGDSPRHIHWPSSARTGGLVVKEYEFINTTNLFIVLDLAAAALFGEQQESTLEYAVKIAASVARFALEEGHGVGILGLGDQPHEVQVGHGMGHFQHILELLARVQADGKLSYRAAVHRAVSRMPRGGILLLFDSPPLEPAHEPERYELHQHHIRPLWVRFDTESFRFPLRRAPRHRAAQATSIYWVRRGDDLSRVFSA